MTKWLKQDGVALLIMAGMFVAAGLLWTSMPEQLPIHWNAAGEVDRWGSKAKGLLMLPIVTLGLYLMMRFQVLFDPRREHVTTYKSVLAVVRLTMVAFMAFVYAMVLAYGRGYRLDMGYVMGLAMGLLFIVLGNYLPKVPSNWFVGVRTPWTLSSERSWNLTHRLAGKCFVLSGFVIILVTWLRPAWSVAALGLTLGPTVVLTAVYSYLVWKRDPDRLGTS